MVTDVINYILLPAGSNSLPFSRRQVRVDIDSDLERAARLQGHAWARHGYDLHRMLELRSPHWPADQRARLILACLDGAMEYFR